MTGHQGGHRVALIASSYHPHFGGVEEHTRHVAAHLVRRGHVVEVWTVDRGERLGVQTVDGIRVRYLPCPLPARRMSSATRFVVSAPVAFGRWVAALRDFRPELLHVQCFGPNGPYAGALSWASGVPLVISAHGETFMDDGDIFGRSALLRRQLRRGCATADAVTACSRVVEDDLRARFGASDVHVVPNGVDQGVVGQVVERLERRADRPTVVAVGRLVQVKGFDLLLRAMVDATTAPRLAIVGDGPERRSLEQLAGRLGLSERVEFLGRQAADDVQRTMSLADVVVVPSRREAFGIVALEAWASGTPLIATARGGPRDFVADGVDGLVVDPEDVPALAEAIDGVLGDPALAARLAARGLESVREFTWDRVAADYERIYRDVMHRRTASGATVRREGAYPLGRLGALLSGRAHDSPP
ncbi:glycosyltransferase family 4 protein [Ornithinimicrobium sp. EGI L100131]|nr:glycosyltransferase family 4 protein [Ornithinimicrobium sediminis]MCE0486874.1 glycosyltransferase family 4 protein [Ornithinimicrobium sediminis]